jgi:hypothetical protein
MDEDDEHDTSIDEYIKDIPIILDTIPRCVREPVSVGKYMNENIDRCELLDVEDGEDTDNYTDGSQPQSDPSPIRNL